MTGIEHLSLVDRVAEYVKDMERQQRALLDAADVPSEHKVAAWDDMNRMLNEARSGLSEIFPDHHTDDSDTYDTDTDDETDDSANEHDLPEATLNDLYLELSPPAGSSTE